MASSALVSQQLLQQAKCHSLHNASCCTVALLRQRGSKGVNLALMSWQLLQQAKSSGMLR